MTDLLKAYAFTAMQIAALAALAWLLQGSKPTYGQVAMLVAIAALARTYHRP